MSTDSRNESPQLPLLHQHQLGFSIEPDLTAYCDQHDLIAVVCAGSQDVVVHRINGQVAFEVTRGDTNEDVIAVKWKPDGSLLGIAWVDGICGVYSGENGKMLSETSILDRPGRDDWRLDLQPPEPIDPDQEEEPSIPVCMGWTAHEAPSKQSIKISSQVEQLMTTEEWYDINEDETLDESNPGQGKTSLSDLANSIATLDITPNLLGVSAIPSHGVRTGPDSSKFSTQANVDGLLDSKEPSSNVVDTLISASTSGYINVLLDDSVKIGSFHLPHQLEVHASHPQCTSQVLLSDTSQDGVFRLHYIDLPLETLGGSLLHIVASNTKRIQNLIAYVTQTIRCIQHDFTTGLQFPTRFMAPISEELSEKQEGDLVTNFTHLAMTGNFTPTILEWLTDIVKETNHKRWDHAINSMYSNVQTHIFENLIPALDRLSIAASALRGHARLHEGTTKFVDPEMFTSLLDDIDPLRLVAQKVQEIVMTEHRQFRAFIKWLRVMIEVGIAGPGSKGANETEEREVQNLDYALLLAYIRDTLTRSKLAQRVDQRPGMQGACSRSDLFAHPIIAALKREDTIEVLNKLAGLEHEAKLEYKGMQDPHAVANLDSLAVRLNAQARVVIDTITKWQSMMLSQPSTLELHELESKRKVLDLRMFPPEDSKRYDNVVHLLTQPLELRPNSLLLHKVTSLANSEKYEILEEKPDLGNGEVIHAQLLDMGRCLVLFKRAEDENIVLIELRWKGQTRLSNRTSLLHLFSSDDDFVPYRFVAGGRPSMMVCVVFRESMDGSKDWKVFDLNGGGDSVYSGPPYDQMDLL